ncbi:MAG: Transcriptional regulator, LysR family [Labilithrix sp.]|nr:Transcriptional regulator, LysR family [Labilithrix sp.]
MLWDDYRLLLTVARTGSHAAAGRELGVAATTIGRRVAVAERDLATKLFERGPRGLTPTTAAARVLERARRAEDELVAAEREAHGDDLRLEGDVRLTAPDGLATLVLAPAIGALRIAHPGVRITLRAENRAVDLSRREADLAVRLFRPEERTLVARRIAALRFGAFASAAYVARYGAPRNADDLAYHDLLLLEGERMLDAKWAAKHAPRSKPVLRCSTTTALVTACAAGHGVALLPELLAGRAASTLLRIPGLSVPSLAMFVVVHGDMRGNARVRAVSTWIEETMRDAELATPRAVTSS